MAPQRERVAGPLPFCGCSARTHRRPRGIPLPEVARDGTPYGVPSDSAA